MTMETSATGNVNVKVLFFAKAKELVKASSQDIELNSKFNAVEDLLEVVETKFPGLKSLNRCFVLALNEEYLSEEAMVENHPMQIKQKSPEILLRDGDELAVIPPLSGG